MSISIFESALFLMKMLKELSGRLIDLNQRIPTHLQQTQELQKGFIQHGKEN